MGNGWSNCDCGLAGGCNLCNPLAYEIVEAMDFEKCGKTIKYRGITISCEKPKHHLGNCATFVAGFEILWKEGKLCQL